VPRIGLVLSGGGARAAYQVGAVSALADIVGPGASPFTIMAGLSAGAINCAALASGTDDLQRAARRLCETWMSLTPQAVYRTDVPKLTTLGVRWLKDLTTGGKLGESRANHLLDTAPLRELLTREIDMTRLQTHVQAGLLHGVALSATSYATGTTVTFFDGAPEIEPWARYDRIAVRTPIRVEHVLASAAIPIFFPPVSVDGTPFGDGGVRMTTPISPAIHLGADRVITIGIRYSRTPAMTLALNREAHTERVSLARIGGVVLNGLFLDSLDRDLERLYRINRTLSLIPEEVRSTSSDLLRPIPALALRPSQDLGRLAVDEHQHFPSMLKHLLRGIGASGEAGWDLLSYLAFQPGYVSQLIELGYDDTRRRRSEVEAFLGASHESALNMVATSH